MILFPIAKINLGLNVVEKRPDGYHNLQTIFYPVPIKDRLEVEISSGQRFQALQQGNDCNLSVTGIQVQGNAEQNLVVRAYRLLKEDFPTLPPITATLHKGIPTQAGMGGGSSDGAFMLRLLNELFTLSVYDVSVMISLLNNRRSEPSLSNTGSSVLMDEFIVPS